ncbi:MAG TPA: DUF1552 domain-containing protein, partial [Hyphomicrobiales bacterium]|nr:DUF1552 domain-containing protein [Hyphomicrobiales bacterium]
MNFLTRKCLSRRAVLRGSGVALALPFLDAMIPALARASEAIKPQPRLACMYLAHGAIMQQWTPIQDGADFALSPILSSLEPHRDYLNVISGLSIAAANIGPNSAGANHARSMQCWLTCTETGRGASPCSMDQVAAQHMGQQTALPSLEMTVAGPGSSIAYLTPTTPLPMEENPRVIFERLFGVASTPQEREARYRQSTSLLDALSGEVTGLKRNLPAPDRERLDRYLDDVREIERRLALSGGSLPENLEMPTKPVGVPDDYEEHLSMMFELIALSWQADLTRVATVLLGRELGNPLFPKSGVPEPFHACSHHSEIPEKIDMFARMNAYHVQAIMARCMDKLRNTPDGEHHLLHNSLVLYGSGMSNSNSHDHGPLPILLAGGAGGKLQGNRHIRTAPDTPMANLLLAMLHKLEV